MLTVSQGGFFGLISFGVFLFVCLSVGFFKQHKIFSEQKSKRYERKEITKNTGRNCREVISKRRHIKGAICRKQHKKGKRGQRQRGGGKKKFSGKG